MKFSDFMRAFLGNRDSAQRQIPSSTSKDKDYVDALIVGPVRLVTFPFTGEPYISEPVIEPKDFTNYADYHAAGGTLSMHGSDDEIGWFDEKRW